MSLPETTNNLIILPCLKEIKAAKKRIVKADVPVFTKTTSYEVFVSELLTEEHIEVEHVAIGRYVAEAPAVRRDGDVTITSLVEEAFERRLLLKEEIHLRRMNPAELMLRRLPEERKYYR